MALADEIRDGLSELETELGSEEFTHGGNNYVCSATSLNRGEIVMIGGIDVEIEMTLLVRPAVITGAVPAIGDAVTFRSTSYRVGRIKTGPATSHYQFDLIDPND